MANLKELRGRIKSVANISQITRAMEMVASMKLRKVQARATTYHPYAEELRRTIERLAGRVVGERRISLFEQRPVRTTGILLITSDRGLCGSYNSNVLGHLRSLVDSVRAEDPERQILFFCYGRKGYTWLTRRGFEVERFFVDPPLDRLDFTSARMVGQTLVRGFEENAVDEVKVVYTRFASMIRFVPTTLPFLPVTGIEPGGEDTESRFELDFLIEPDAATVLNALLPRYLETIVFDTMLQSLTSEYAARRMAMKGATDAAGRMGRELRKAYNRARQENITKELLDIVGGATAVQ